MLLISWLVIRRMVRNVLVAEFAQWRAWHDMLTRLFNRGALFERAGIALAACQQANEPLAVISSTSIISKALMTASVTRPVTGC